MSEGRMFMTTMVLSPVIGALAWIATWVLTGQVPSFEASLVIGSISGLVAVLIVALMSERVR